MYSKDDEIKRYTKKQPEYVERPPTVVLADEKTTWLHYLQNSTKVREACGLNRDKDGVWILVDKQLAEKLPEPRKTWLREFLNERRVEGKFSVEKDEGNK